MKVTKSISIDVEYAQYMDAHDINISRWVNQKMKEEFKSKEVRIKEVEEEILKKQKIIEEIKNEDAKKLERLQEKINKLSQDARVDLIEAKGILERDPSYFDGRFGRYRYLFDKTVTVDEFKILLNNIK